MKYKTGDKFVIEIDSVMTNKKGTLYGIKGFKSLVFDEYGLDLLERVDAKEDFQVGDEVRYKWGEVGIVTRIIGKTIDVLCPNGDTYDWTTEVCKKTGRHFDEVEKLLRKIGE